MIRLNTETIKKNEKILRGMIDKDDLYSSNFYLNFKDGLIQFKSGVTKDGQEFHGHLKVPFEVEKDHENFNVDALTFLHLCSNYETLHIKDFHFYAGSEKFKLKILDEITHNDPVCFEDFTWDNSTTLSMSSLRQLEKATKFTGERFPAINIDSFEDKSLVASADLGIYFESVLDMTIPRMQLSEKVIRIFSDSDSQELRYGCSDTHFYINLDNKLELITSLPSFAVLPFVSPEFRERFDVPEIFSFEKKALSDVIKFFKPFFVDVFQKVIEVSFLKDRVVLSPVLQDYEVTKTLLEIIPENMVGKKFNLSLDYLEKVLSVLDQDRLVFSSNVDLEDDKKDFCIFTGKDNSQEKILCKFIIL